MKKILAFITALMTALSFAVTASAITVPDEFVKLIENSIENRRSDIDITDISRKYGWKYDDFFDYYEAVFFRHPEYFYVDLGLSYSTLSDGTSSGIYLEYTLSKKQAEAMLKEIDAAAEEVVAGITDDMSDIMKCLYVHDYIILDCEYDTSYERHQMFDCLVDKTCVCQGYALAYMYILNKYLDIECTTVFTEDHIWNYVNIDGNWYHVDLTYDDPLVGYNGDALDMYGRVSHVNFMMSDELCRMTSSDHTKWTIAEDLPAADDKSLDDAFWRDCNSRICMLDGKYYYTLDGVMNANNEHVLKLFSYDPVKDRSTFETQITGNWYRRRQTGSNSYAYGKNSYNSSYCSLESNGSMIYLNSNKIIYIYDTEMHTLKEFYTLKKGDEKQIFGMTITNGKLRVVYKDDLTYANSYVNVKISVK